MCVEDMLIEQRRRSRVSMILDDKPQSCRDLVRDCMHRFVFEVIETVIHNNKCKDSMVARKIGACY